MHQSENLDKRCRGFLQSPCLKTRLDVQDVALALNVAASSLSARKAAHHETSPGPPTSEYAPTANEIKRAQVATANITGVMLSYVPPSIEVCSRDWDSYEELISSHFTKQKTTLLPHFVRAALDESMM